MSLSMTLNRYRAVNLTDIVEIRPNIGDETSWVPESMPSCFKRSCKEHGSKVALVTADKKTYTFDEYLKHSFTCARAIIDLGLKPMEIVSVIGFNAPEYLFTVHGAHLTGCVASAIYSTNSAEACEYVLKHSESRLIIVDGKGQMDKIVSIRDKLPNLSLIVVYNSSTVTEWPSDNTKYAKVITWEAFLEKGAKEDHQIVVDERSDACVPGQCLSLIYTSGTTGDPKAVMLSHDNVVWTSKSAAKVLGLDAKDRVVSFLPLSHIAAQMIDVFIGPITGFTLYFAMPDALKGTLVQTFQYARPTFLVCVPRVFEKMAGKVLQKLKSLTGVKAMLANWAQGLGSANMNNIQVGAEYQSTWGYTLANRLVLNGIKTELGLDQARLIYSAAAPIDIQTLKAMASFDIRVQEIFGMSECTGPTTMHQRDKWVLGTCGHEFIGTSVKTDPVSKEILVNGRHIFMGYMKMPDMTLSTIDKDGWVHSGDCGEIGSNGMWSITGRIKELIITAGGENIPPVLIEGKLKELAPCVSNAMLVGDRKQFLSVLFTLKSIPELGHETLTAEAASVAATIGSQAKTVEEAIGCPHFSKYFGEVLAKYNEGAFSQAQRIQKFVILSHDFTLETGELTPSLKLKRQTVLLSYASVIEKLYNSAKD